jgi:hypothetical protein
MPSTKDTSHRKDGRGREYPGGGEHTLKEKRKEKISEGLGRNVSVREEGRQERKAVSTAPCMNCSSGLARYYDLCLRWIGRVLVGCRHKEKHQYKIQNETANGGCLSLQTARHVQFSV